MAGRCRRAHRRSSAGARRSARDSSARLRRRAGWRYWSSLFLLGSSGFKAVDRRNTRAERRVAREAARQRRKAADLTAASGRLSGDPTAAARRPRASMPVPLFPPKRLVDQKFAVGRRQADVAQHAAVELRELVAFAIAPAPDA